MAHAAASSPGLALSGPVRDLPSLALARKAASSESMDRATELDQIKRAAAGDPDAVRAIVVGHTARLHALAFRMLQSAEDAEEVVQETFLRAWKVLPRWTAKAKLSTWLHRVALNLCYDRLRKRREYNVDELPDMIDTSARPGDALANRQKQAHVQAAVTDLPDRQRAAITLCALEGHSNREAAEILETSVEALESLLARARRTLKTTLSALWEEQI
ncbi:MAG: sigma-70 family RNA polymerase sigma factor [Pseudomonadota bacterium]